MNLTICCREMALAMSHIDKVGCVRLSVMADGVWYVSRRPDLNYLRTEPITHCPYCGAKIEVSVPDAPAPVVQQGQCGAEQSCSTCDRSVECSWSIAEYEDYAASNQREGRRR